MDLTTPARVARVAEKIELSRLLARLLVDLDITQRELARICGVSKALVARWCDRDRLETPSIADIRQMPRPLAEALSRWATSPHALVVSDAPVGECVEERLEHLAATIRETGEATAAYAATATSGPPDPAKATLAVTEIDEAMEQLARAKETLLPHCSRGPRPVPRPYTRGRE